MGRYLFSFNFGLLQTLLVQILCVCEYVCVCVRTRTCMHKWLCSYCCWSWISIKEICWLYLTFLRDSKLFPSGHTIHSSNITRIPISPVLTSEKVAVCCLDYDYPSGYEVVSWIASICISPVMCDTVHMFAVKLSFLWGNAYLSLLPLSFIYCGIIHTWL